MTPAPDTPPEFDLSLAEASAWVGAGPEGIGETALEPTAREQLDIEGDDPAVALRQTLGMFATGVTVITTRVGDQIHGMTANAFMSVSLEPPLVLISVDRRTKMCTLLHEGQRFAVSVLAADQHALSDRFAGRAPEDDPEPQLRDRARDAGGRGLGGAVRRPTSCVPTGAATTRSSSAGSSTRGARRTRSRCSSTAASTRASRPAADRRRRRQLRGRVFFGS